MSPLIHPSANIFLDVPIANVIHVKLVCDQCERLGLQADCRHMRKYLPPWKDPKKYELSSIIYGDEHKSLFLQESMGMCISYTLFHLNKQRSLSNN